MLKKVLVMKDGMEYEIVDDKGKYYICENTQFRKGNPEIDHIEKRKEEKPADDQPKADKKEPAKHGKKKKEAEIPGIEIPEDI